MTDLGDVSMSPGSITALAAIFGSLVGGLGQYKHLDNPEASGSSRTAGKKGLPSRAAIFRFYHRNRAVLVDALESVKSYSVSRSHRHEVSSPRIFGLPLLTHRWMLLRMNVTTRLVRSDNSRGVASSSNLSQASKKPLNWSVSVRSKAAPLPAYLAP
jgi:hypothetical protein